MQTRPWLTPTADARESEILAAHYERTTDQTRSQVDTLIKRNRQIHERDCINLNPATNVLSPRAEAALSLGLGSRPSLGHPGEKYEMGLEAIEELEVITAALAATVFEAEFVEIKALSGAMSNLMAFMACTSPGDPIIVPPPTIGGHVTHNATGAAGLYGLEIHEAPIDPDRYTVDVEGVRELARRVKPKLISIGTSLNLLAHPVAELREVADECGAILLFDAAHACGMFAGQQWPNPLTEGAHLMTMSTYKSLAGPAGGLIVTNDAELAHRVDTIGYPGLTANFDVGRTTALALTLADWIDTGTQYGAEMRASAAALTAGLHQRGVALFETAEGPTDSHQFALIDQTPGQTVHRLRSAGVLTSEIGLPTGSGVRMGTPEVVRWGMATADMDVVAGFITDALRGDPSSVAPRVAEFRSQFSTITFCAD